MKRKLAAVQMGTLLRGLINKQGHRIATRLNQYTARWPPKIWKTALMLFCIICGLCCLMAAFGIL